MDPQTRDDIKSREDAEEENQDFHPLQRDFMSFLFMISLLYDEFQVLIIIIIIIIEN